LHAVLASGLRFGGAVALSPLPSRTVSEFIQGAKLHLGAKTPWPVPGAAHGWQVPECWVLRPSTRRLGDAFQSFRDFDLAVDATVELRDTLLKHWLITQIGYFDKYQFCIDMPITIMMVRISQYLCARSRHV
jgi:hypothetical protein